MSNRNYPETCKKIHQLNASYQYVMKIGIFRENSSFLDSAGANNEIIAQILDFSFVFDIFLIEIAQKLVKKSVS
jgi:hypothetical protein